MNLKTPLIIVTTANIFLQILVFPISASANPCGTIPAQLKPTNNPLVYFYECENKSLARGASEEEALAKATLIRDQQAQTDCIFPFRSAGFEDLGAEKTTEISFPPQVNYVVTLHYSNTCKSPSKFNASNTQSLTDLAGSLSKKMIRKLLKAILSNAGYQ